MCQNFQNMTLHFFYWLFSVANLRKQQDHSISPEFASIVEKCRHPIVSYGRCISGHQQQLQGPHQWRQQQPGREPLRKFAYDPYRYKSFYLKQIMSLNLLFLFTDSFQLKKVL